MPVMGNEETGYCQHMSVLFATWHRPYLSLMEVGIFFFFFFFFEKRRARRNHN